LAADLRGHPPGNDRDEAGRAHQQREAMQPGPVVQLLPHPGGKAPEAEQEHQKAKPDHHSEGPEDDLGRRAVLLGHALQPLHRRVEIVLQDERGELGDFERVFQPLLLIVRNAEKSERSAVRVALVMPLHRHHLGGLVLERVEAMEIADHDLHGRHEGGHPHRHRKHDADALMLSGRMGDSAPSGLPAPLPEKMPGPHPAYDQSRR
jgi:hypothetical protein